MSLKEIRDAFSSIVVRGLLDWKMPIFLGFVLTLSNVALLLNTALHGYATWDDIGKLDWWLIWTSVVGNAALQLVAFCSKSVARKSDELNQRDKNEKADIVDAVNPRP